MANIALNLRQIAPIHPRVQRELLLSHSRIQPGFAYQFTKHKLKL